MKIAAAKNILAKLYREAEAEALETTKRLYAFLLNPLDTPPDFVQKAVKKAQKAYHRAFAPYSEFSVGAAVVGESGRIWEGANVESSSYGLTICAERVALCAAVVRGERQIAATVVYTPQQLTPPCGACRQMLYEFGPLSVVLLTNGEESEWIPLSLLLPKAFSRTLLRFHK